MGKRKEFLLEVSMLSSLMLPVHMSARAYTHVMGLEVMAVSRNHLGYSEARLPKMRPGWRPLQGGLQSELGSCLLPESYP